MLLEKDLTAQALYDAASALLDDPEKRREMSKNIRRFAKPEALKNIYACIKQAVGK